MKYGIIYMLKNKINGKIYIGQTTRNMSDRLQDHLNEKRNRVISNSLRKYGLENFEITELCSCFDLDSLNQMEVYFVQNFKSMAPNGYNMRAGGNQNGICSNELKAKISLAKAGRPNYKRRGEIRSEEQKLKISKTLGGSEIKATNLITGEIKIYATVHDTKKDGHNPSNVVSICKKYGRRYHSKNWTFEYVVLSR